MRREQATHEGWMRRALELARRGEGLTRPNPPVGAVVVAKGKAVGEGYHHRAGQPHAEVLALRAAGEKARGATLYVTLEPCSTWGRTPPCTEAVLAAGIARVVVCLRDPNPAHAGRGLRILKRKGVEVLAGVLEEEGRDLLAPFSKWIQTRQPYLTLKLGMTLDGRIADASGCSRWITGPQARRHVHILRRRCDAILVGWGTLCLDDPQLTPRPARGRAPYRVVVAGRGELPLQARVFTDDGVARTLVAVPRDYEPDRIRALEERGVAVLALPARQGRISLKRLFQALGQLGILHVLCEGGGELAAGLIAGGWVDEYLFFCVAVPAGRKGKECRGGRGLEAGRESATGLS